MHSSQVLLLTVVSVVVIAGAYARSVPHIGARIREKHSTADIRIFEHQAEIGMGRHFPRACKKVGCGLLDMHIRSQRATSDQRLLELQALIALAKGGGSVAHGQIDPHGVGKKKRSFLQNEILDFTTYDNRKLMLLEKIAEQLMATEES